jgi:tetratricopeptide (TPR) repeat protein
MKKTMSLAVLASALLTFISIAHADPAEILTLDPAQLKCADLRTHGTGKLSRCEATTDAGYARMNTLSLEGTLSEIGYDHGFLLAQEIENGSLAEALSNINKLKAEIKNRIFREALMGVVSCYENRISRSLDDEFNNAIASLGKGYRDSMIAQGLTPKYTIEDLETATYSIELGNVLGSIYEQMKVSPVKGAARVLKDCGRPLGKAALHELMTVIKEKILGKTEFACTGAVVPSNLSKDGFLYHARNLEQTSMVESWNKNPTTFIIHETGHYKYVAFGTAGLLFPGGISGYNEKGIAVSMHQMDVAHFGSGYAPGTAAMTPYLQQRILREAATIDEAIALAKSVHAFAAWTILISDAKTNRVASLEISPQGVVVARDRIEQGMGQSNHFVAAESQGRTFFDGYNYFLETNSRLSQVEHRLQTEKFGLPEILSLLASHNDWYEGATSFGRTVGRVSNIMSTIASPKQNRVWITLSDRMPSNQGYYISYAVDFENMKLTPVNAVKTADYVNTPNWEASFSKYQRAFRYQNAGDLLSARKTLEEALALAQKDGKDDLTYHYLIARFLLNEGDADGALEHFKVVDAKADTLHPFKRASLRMYEIYAMDHAKKPSVMSADEVKTLRDTYADEAIATVQSILNGSADKAMFPLAAGGVVPQQKELKKQIKLIQRVWARSSKAKLPGVDMKTGI